MKIKIANLAHQKNAITSTIHSIKAGLPNKIANKIAIEMETGTGKTFVFISSIFEIYQEFAKEFNQQNQSSSEFSKFIIVVPRVAIKEGVFKTFEIFSEHFKDKYNNIAFEIHNYESKNIKSIDNFISGSGLQILLLTKQSFDKESNILRDNNRDNLFGNENKINQIKTLKPIVIIDEPQLNKDFNLNKIDELLTPSLTLSYSATHPKENQEQIIYSYSPKQAYLDRQVKRLEYFSITISGNISSSISLEKTDATKKTAKIKYNGKSSSLKIGDNLGEKLKDKELLDYTIRFITADNIIFESGKKFSDLVNQAGDENLILKEQIRQTILHHKQKQERLKDNKIKALSLFFVPTVADFVNQNDDGIVKKIFLEEYEKIYNQNPQDKFAYYFSETSKIKGTKENQEKEMTKLILKEKEQLLSFENPAQFIFAHTSLGIGWDNPNIFNICFLRNIASEQNKKQFIGRGLRLCVNCEGERIFENATIRDEERLNNLTIIGNLSYEKFCGEYQKEAGWSGSDNPIKKPPQENPQKIFIKPEKENLLKHLWQRLKTKTSWYIDFGNLEIFYQKIINQLNALVISQKVMTTTIGDIAGQVDYEKATSINIKNIYSENEIISKIKAKTWLCVWEVRNILDTIDKENIKNNPEKWTDNAIEIINNERRKHIISLAQIKYQKNGEEFSEENFIIKARESYHNNLTKSEKSLFNLIDFDSGEEEKFVKLADNNPNVELLVKMPKGLEETFHINTPIGKYTPDFALLVKANSNDLYLIFEVKSKKPQDLSEEEQFKIKCAIKHFEELGFKTEPKFIEHQGAQSLEISSLNEDCYKVYIPNN